MSFPEPRPELLHSDPSSRAPALEGDLSAFPPTDLFQFFGVLGLSGTLEIEREGKGGVERVALRLRGGRLVEAETTGPRVHLGELLVRRFGIPLDAVLEGLRCQTAARRQGRITSRLGEILIEQRQLSPEVLRLALDEALARIAGPVLLWEQGRFAFRSLHPEEAERGSPPRSGPGHGSESTAPEVSLEELALRRWQPPEEKS